MLFFHLIFRHAIIAITVPCDLCDTSTKMQLALLLLVFYHDILLISGKLGHPVNYEKRKHKDKLRKQALLAIAIPACYFSIAT